MIRLRNIFYQNIDPDHDLSMRIICLIRVNIELYMELMDLLCHFIRNQYNGVPKKYEFMLF